jgi:hypothetical protein
VDSHPRTPVRSCDHCGSRTNVSSPGERAARHAIFRGTCRDSKPRATIDSTLRAGTAERGSDCCHAPMVDRALMTTRRCAGRTPASTFQYLLACYKRPMPSYGPPTAGAVAYRH